MAETTQLKPLFDHAEVDIAEAPLPRVKLEIDQIKNGAELQETLSDAQALLDTYGVQAQRDRVTHIRQYSWDSPETRKTHVLQQLGTDNGEGVTWEWPLVFSLLGDADDTYERRCNLAPNLMQAQTLYQEEHVSGEANDEMLHATQKEIRRELEHKTAQQEARVGAAGAIALHQVPVTEIRPRTQEMPSLQISTNLQRRLARISDIVDGEGAITYADGARCVAGAKQIDLGADRDGRRFSLTHIDATYHRGQSKIATTLTVIEKDEQDRDKRNEYDMLPDGRLAMRTSNPAKVMDERAELFKRIQQLNQHVNGLEQKVRQGTIEAPLYQRLSVIMEAARAAGEQTVRSSRTMRIGEREVDLNLRELHDRFVVNLIVVSPDGQSPRPTRLIVYKDKHRGMATTIGGEHNTPELVDAALSHMLQPQQPTENTPTEIRSVYHEAFLALDDSLAELGIPVEFGREAQIGPHISRRQQATMTINGQDYLVERFGRLGPDDEFEPHYTRITVTDNRTGRNARVYDLTSQHGLVPVNAYRGGVAPKMSRRQRLQAEQDFSILYVGLSRP